MCPQTEDEIKAELEARPEWMVPHILENPNKFTVDTLILAYDISAYFGEVIVKNNSQIYWGYLTRPKKLYGVNRPQLLGFTGNVPVFPYGRVEICMRRSLKSADKTLLYNMYEICLRMI